MNTSTTEAARATSSANLPVDTAPWRGDPGFFPTMPGLVYREYPAKTNPDRFGDGLRSPDDRNRKKDLPVPNLPADASRAEMLIFGNGLINGECWFNDQSLPLRTLSEIAMGKIAYPTCSYSVDRSYSIAEVPLALVQKGGNTIRVPKVHAYLQTAVLRVFRAQPSAAKLALEVERPDSSYRLRLTGTDLDQVRSVQFFARFRGPDFEMSGRESTWQATYNRQRPEFDETYEVANHCGTATQAPWTVTWNPKLVPDGRIEFRCRVQTVEDEWIESPGGMVEQMHEAVEIIVMCPAVGFAPWGFHVCGPNQDVSTRCEFRLEGPGFHAVEGRELKRAVLALPLYGSVDLDLKGHHSRLQLRIDAPIGGYYVRHINLPAQMLFSRMNQLHLKASGETGCFQGPGPVLYMIYDKSRP